MSAHPPACPRVVQREKQSQLCFDGEVVVVAEHTVPEAPIMRRILAAGGAAVLPADTIPPAQSVSLVVLPANAPHDHGLLVKAVEHGIVCVPHTYILDQLTLQDPSSREKYDLRRGARRRP